MIFGINPLCRKSFSTNTSSTKPTNEPTRIMAILAKMKICHERLMTSGDSGAKVPVAAVSTKMNAQPVTNQITANGMIRYIFLLIR